MGADAVPSEYERMRKMKFVASIPQDEGGVKAMCVHQGKIYIATAYAVFVVDPDDKAPEVSHETRLTWDEPVPEEFKL